jgi:hypothetical protein
MIKSLPNGVVAALVQHYSPDEIWLFGSRATGAAREDSDWDILVLLPSDVEKNIQSSIPGNEILRKAGFNGDVHHRLSDVFHAAAHVPNSMARIIGDERILLYHRDGYVPKAISRDDAFALFLSRHRDDASEYLAAANVLKGEHYGRISLLRFATRYVLAGLLTKENIHIGGDAFRTGGKAILLERIPDDARSPELDDGIALLDRLNALDHGEMHEFVAQPSPEDIACLDKLHLALERLLPRLE